MDRMPTKDQRVGARVAAARKMAGITKQGELAKRINTAKLGAKNIGKIERGERALEEHEAPLFAAALGVPVEFFYEDAGEAGALPQLDRIEARLDEANEERSAMRQLISHQNGLLARQSEILTRIEGLVAGLPTQEELNDLRRAIGNGD